MFAFWVAVYIVGLVFVIRGCQRMREWDELIGHLADSRHGGKDRKTLKRPKRRSIQLKKQLSRR
jgi:hypothetical protein